MEQSLTIGTEKEIGVDGGIVSAKASLSTEIGFSANQQWTSSREETNEETHSEEQTQEQSKESDSSTSNEESYENTETNTVECSGTITVLPSHSMQTILTM